MLLVSIMSGWALSFRHRYVTDTIISSGSVQRCHWSNYHRFFSEYAWDIDEMCEETAKALVARFAPAGVILASVDDTLCLRRGLTLYGAGMHYDPLISSRNKKLTRWGHNWVVVSLLVVNPPWAPTKVFALPIAARLYRNRQGLTKGKKKSPQAAPKRKKKDPNHRTRPELAAEMLEMIAAWFPERTLLVAGDSAYGGQSVLKKLPANMHLISHVHPGGAMYEPAPPRQPDTKGRNRKKGARLPGMAAWAEDASTPWKEYRFDQFGFHATVEVKVRQALYYKAGGTRLLTIVLVRDKLGQRPDQMFYCTALDWSVRQILATYAHRWATELTFQNGKQLLGFADPANRTEQAVRRTAPTAMLLYSQIVAWFDGEGHRHLQYPERPWYPHKEEPSFADMLSTLRRMSWEEQFRDLQPADGPLQNKLAQLIQFVSLAG
jgi:hypothetical protein